MDSARDGAGKLVEHANRQSCCLELDSGRSLDQITTNGHISKSAFIAHLTSVPPKDAWTNLKCAKYHHVLCAHETILQSKQLKDFLWIFSILRTGRIGVIV